MEGGAVEFNGKGTVLTTTSCLLHENRNPELTQEELEEFLREYYGIEQVLWLGDGINGDDTNGHIDDHTRFFSEDSVVTAIEVNRQDVNYEPLRLNLQALKKMRILNGRQLTIAEIPNARTGVVRRTASAGIVCEFLYNKPFGHCTCLSLPGR